MSARVGILTLLPIALGVAIVIRTITLGVGGGLGFVFGALLMLAGILRFYLSRAG
ncbi:MAG: hypothetical protein ABI896_09255 [Actinomycetota bacterium]